MRTQDFDSLWVSGRQMRLNEKLLRGAGLYAVSGDDLA